MTSGIFSQGLFALYKGEASRENGLFSRLTDSECEVVNMLLEERSITTKHDAVKTILVVEDDEDTQALFTDALSMFTHFHVQVVGDETEALDCSRHIGPSLLILDFRLPKMNGIQLYDQLHAIPGLENIPTIIVSTIASEQVRRDIESRKLTLIEKPFDLDVFLDTITQALA